MADRADPTNYPLPVFHFKVECGTWYAGVAEVSGLTQEVQAIEYRDGMFKEYSSRKFPGLRKYSNVTVNRPVFKSDNQFFEWLTTIKMHKVERRDLVVSLLDEEHNPVMSWHIHNAFPVKLEGPGLKATGNEVAIESIELAHEGISLKND